MKHLSIIATLALCATLQAVEPVILLKQENINTGSSGNVIKSGTVVNKDNLAEGAGRIEGKSMLFNNSADGKERGKYAGILIPSDKTGMDFTKPFTMTAYVQLAKDIKNNGPQYTIAGTTKSDYGPGWRLLYSWGSFRFYAGSGQKAQPGEKTSLSIPSSNFKIVSSNWNHIALSYDGKIVKLYLNGELTCQEEITIHNGENNISIGCYGRGYAYGFRGSLSEVKFFNETLTAEQILADMMNEK